MRFSNVPRENQRYRRAKQMDSAEKPPARNAKARAEV